MTKTVFPLTQTISSSQEQVVRRCLDIMTWIRGRIPEIGVTFFGRYSRIREPMRIDRQPHWDLRSVNCVRQKKIKQYSDLRD